MQFGPNQNRRFKSADGAYSTVTAREYDDSQITLTDHEARIVLDHFGEASILRGAVKLDPDMAAKEFTLYSTGETIGLNIIYPKAEGNELRLYLRRNFKPEGGLVFFLFLQGDKLWIGAMTEAEWRAGSADMVRDDSDSTYQEAILESSKIKIATLKERDIYVRDRMVALTSMENSGYLCELNNTHELFISRRTGNHYVEAHHLIPMAFQPEFSESLDTVPNVYCLCPNCHRAVHYAQKETTRTILENLIGKRDVLSDFNIGVNDLYALYGVEDIV